MKEIFVSLYIGKHGYEFLPLDFIRKKIQALKGLQVLNPCVAIREEIVN